jgi:hypothetical protein
MKGRALALAIAASAAIAVAACGGDDGDGGADPGALAAEYRAAVERFRIGTFRAEYKISLKTGDEGIETTFTWYKQGTRQQRFDYFRDETDEHPATVLSFPGRSVICFEGIVSEQLTTPVGVCVEGAQFPEELTSAEATLLALQAPATGELAAEFDTSVLIVESRSGREIAGEQATCFALSDAQGRTYQDCYSDGGVPLYRRIDKDGEAAYIREATAVSGEVKAAYLEPPFEVAEPQAPAPTAVPTP